MLLSAVACNSGNTGAKIDGADSTAVAEAVKPVNPKALLPSKASVDSVSYLLGIQLGSMIKGYHLGELNSFYIRIPHWDTMLHTINGFCCAAVGFALVDMLNRNKKFSLKLSPLYLAIAAFCFSVALC